MRFITKKIAILLIAPFFAHCASTQQQGQDGYENQQQADDEYSQQGENEYSNQENEENYDNEDGGNQYDQGSNDYNDGENVNNAEDEDYGDDFDGQYNGEGVNNAPAEEEVDQMVNDILGADATAGQSANELPQEGLDAVRPPDGNGIVKYAPGPVSVLDQPSGSVIGQLEQGDHPLVYDEGEFSRLSDGRYVGINDLSTNGVGRARQPGIWQ